MSDWFAYVLGSISSQVAWLDFLFPSWLRSLITTVSSIGMLMASGVAVLLYRNQNRMLYHPTLPGLPRDPARNQPRLRNPAEWGMDYEDVEVPFWRAELSRQNLFSSVSFRWTNNALSDEFREIERWEEQENAGNMGMRLPNMHMLWQYLHVNIFMVSYRGYGRSEDRKRIVVLGRSLGGAVGIYLASSEPAKIRGLIVENTFTSIADMVDVVLPWVAPLKSLVLRINWRSIDAIPSITCPILFICGLQDELVPPAHMRRLYEAAVLPAVGAVKRRWYAVPDGTHNDTSMRNPAGYCRELQAWFEEVAL